MRIVVGAIAVVVGLGLAAPAAHADQIDRCTAVVVQFIGEHPAIYAEAGSPSIKCLDRGLKSGNAGEYSAGENHIDISSRLSKLARESGVANAALVPYWRNTVAHEVGHAWAHANGLDERWPEYAAMRGVPAADEAFLREDYAEVFALSLGWHCPPKDYTRNEPSGYYDFVIASEPTGAQIASLEQSFLLPAP